MLAFVLLGARLLAVAGPTLGIDFADSKEKFKGLQLVGVDF